MWEEVCAQFPARKLRNTLWKKANFENIFFTEVLFAQSKS